MGKGLPHTTQRGFKMSGSTERRLHVLGGQLAGAAEPSGQQLARDGTKGNEAVVDLCAEDSYAVSLPEKLSPDGDWQVYRQANAPLPSCSPGSM